MIILIEEYSRKRIENTKKLFGRHDLAKSINGVFVCSELRVWIKRFGQTVFIYILTKF